MKVKWYLSEKQKNITPGKNSRPMKFVLLFNQRRRGKGLGKSSQVLVRGGNSGFHRRNYARIQVRNGEMKISCSHKFKIRSERVFEKVKHVNSHFSDDSFEMMNFEERKNSPNASLFTFVPTDMHGKFRIEIRENHETTSRSFIRFPHASYAARIGREHHSLQYFPYVRGTLILQE